MAAKLLLSLGLCWCSGGLATAEGQSVPRADDLHWLSLDFKTVLIWTSPSGHSFTVLYATDDGDWTESPDCIRVQDQVCDLTGVLQPLDRFYTADVQTDTAEAGYDYDEDEFPHTYSSQFNPYRQSNLSAVSFTLDLLNQTTVSVNITDTVTAVHHRGQQLSIRDVLTSDLMYKISYYKDGSTGKRYVTSSSSVALVSQLDPGESYCFLVAAFVPSRPRETQQGAWSSQQCTQSQGSAQGWSLGALVGLVFIVIIIFIIITVAVLCCNRRRRRDKSLQVSQTSAPI